MKGATWKTEPEHIFTFSIFLDQTVSISPVTPSMNWVSAPAIRLSLEPNSEKQTHKNTLTKTDHNVLS